jgi:thymidylate kinase
MKIITISGLDGSGKSTQINLLKNYLTSQGKKVFYFHAIKFSIATKLAKLKKKYCIICKIKGMCKIPSTAKSVTKANWLQIQLRKLFLKIDLSRFRTLIKKLEQENYDYLLSDRYFYDTLANIEYLSKKEIDLNYSIIKPRLSIYLQTNPKSIMNRDRKPDQGLQYLIDKEIIYNKFAPIFEMKVINGNDGPDIVQQNITNHTIHII